MSRAAPRADRRFWPFMRAFKPLAHPGARAGPGCATTGPKKAPVIAAKGGKAKKTLTLGRPPVSFTADLPGVQGPARKALILRRQSEFTSCGTGARNCRAPAISGRMRPEAGLRRRSGPVQPGLSDPWRAERREVQRRADMPRPTGDQFVADKHPTGKPGWWEVMVGLGPADRHRPFLRHLLQRDRWCMGTTGPSDINPATGKPWPRPFR